MTGKNFTKHTPEDKLIVHKSYESQNFQFAFGFQGNHTWCTNNVD